MEKRGYVPLTMSVRWRSLVWVSVLGSLVWVVVLASDPAHASRLTRANVVLEGYVGQAPAGITPAAQLVLQSLGTNYQFALTRTAVNAGSRARRQLLDDIRPFKNKLVLRGSTSALSGLVSASPGQKLVINGYHATGTRTLHVSRIEPAAPDPTPAPAHP